MKKYRFNNTQNKFLIFEIMGKEQRLA